MDSIEGKLARLETMLVIALENQESAKERYSRMADSLQETSSRLLFVERKVEEILQGKADFIIDYVKLETRVDSLEATREQGRTVWVILKWIGGIMAAFFTISLAVGEKIAKIVASWSGS